MSESIKSVEEFHAWVNKLEGRLLVYRGLADVQREIESSAYRRIKQPEVDSPPVFQNYITRLLDEAGLRGFRKRQDRNLGDLELLAELQHHGAATCLIDFTTNALIALWFACEEKNNAGKVVAMATGDTDRFSIVNYEDLNKSIIEFLNKNKLWKWEPSHQNNRIIAQQSVFVFGEGKIEKNFYKEIKIDRNSKESIRDELKKLGITEQHLFSDFTGFARSNAHNKSYDYTAEDHLDMGLTFEQRRDYKKAIEQYNKAILLNSKYTGAYNNRGIAKDALGNHKGAITDYGEAIRLNPQYAAAYNNRGSAKHASGDHEGAITDYGEAIRLDPQYAIAYYNRGDAKYALGDYKGTITDCDEAIRLNPKLTEAYNNRGIAKGTLGNYKGAIEDCDEAIRLNPQYAAAYYNRGIAKRALGDHNGAIKDYNQALSLNPQDAATYYNRGIAKRALGNHVGAIEDCDEAIRLKPKYAEAYNNRGNAKRALGNHVGAIADYDEAIRLKPKYAEAYNNRGNAKHAIGNEAGAEEDFAKADELSSISQKLKKN